MWRFGVSDDELRARRVWSSSGHTHAHTHSTGDTLGGRAASERAGAWPGEGRCHNSRGLCSCVRGPALGVSRAGLPSPGTAVLDLPVLGSRFFIGKEGPALGWHVASVPRECQHTQHLPVSSLSPPMHICVF